MSSAQANFPAWGGENAPVSQRGGVCRSLERGIGAGTIWLGFPRAVQSTLQELSSASLLLHAS